MPEFVHEFSQAEYAAIAKEFLRVGDNTYLDHAGTTLYSENQVEAAAKVLKENLFCNPHTCKVTGDLVDQVRYRILRHFNTNASEYAVIFTANATAALKLVAETFQFAQNADEQKGGFFYCQENHTSVLGMREIVGTSSLYVLSKQEIMQNLQNKQANGCSSTKTNCNSLIAFSAQCNFSGYKMDLNVIDRIHQRGLNCLGKQLRGAEQAQDFGEFYVCLDTASYVASNYLDLQKYKPDFCCISFYKMFGFPTGVGALLVSRRGQQALRKSYYGGGTVQIAMTRQNFHKKRQGFVEHFEDGTLPFLSIASLLQGFRTLETLLPSTASANSMQRISQHVFGLAKHAHASLAELKHDNGQPLVRFYNHHGYDNISQQGGILTFNIMHRDGSYVGFAEVACIAAVHNVIIRTGCFCNPGACQHFLQLSNEELMKQFEAGHICSDYNDLVDGVPTGAVRMSFGYMTRLEDVCKAIDMIRQCYLSTAQQRLKMLEQKSESLPKALRHIPQRLKPRMCGIYIYPIKSCAAFGIGSAQAWQINSSGLAYDRCWMIVDETGMAITQKHHTRLCLIKPKVDVTQGKLYLEFAGMPTISIPLEAEITEAQTPVKSALCHSKVCNDLVEGVDCGAEVAAWLSNCLETSGLRLLRQNTLRRDQNGELKAISLVNQAQFLLINRTSVAWLASKVETEQEALANTVDRFRANIIIETANALEENDFEELSIGGISFKVDGFCTRCQMICIDQHSGQKTAEPLRTIAREFGGKIRFGIYLSLKSSVSSEEPIYISCGSPIDVKLKPTK